MVENTLKKIHSIEARAAGIIDQAKRAGALDLIKHREKAAAELRQAEADAKQLAAELSQAATASAQAEIKEIEARNKSEVKELRAKAQTRITAAKKEILRCLS
jgi:vacuolar-type H+-ATPase subunit H